MCGSRSGPGAWPWPGGWTAPSSGRSKASSAPASRRCARPPVSPPARSQCSGAPATPHWQCCYSHRQRRAFENLKFVLEEALEGRSVTAPDADADYAASVARPMRDAQALVAGRRVAVIRRLLGYLAPYRRQLTLGMAAATLITLVSLVPPYLAGYVIDRVVRPAQEGRLDVGRAGAIAWLAVAAMALV